MGDTTGGRDQDEGHRDPRTHDVDRLHDDEPTDDLTDDGAVTRDDGPPSQASAIIAELWKQREASDAESRHAAPPSSPPGRGSGSSSGSGSGSGVPYSRAERPKRSQRFAPPIGAPAAPGGPQPTRPSKPSGGGSRVPIIAAAAVVAVVVLGGAGYLVFGGGGGPSREAFAASADEICHVRDVGGAVGESTSYPELETAAGAFASATEGQVGQLRQLELPGGGAGTEAKTVIADLELVSQAATELSVAAASKDELTAVSALEKLVTRSDDTTGAAGVFGMSACGITLAPAVESLMAGTNTVVKVGFTARADVLCRASADEWSQVPPMRDESYAEVLRVVEMSVEASERLGSQLRALPVPPADKETVEEMWAALEEVQAKGREMLTSVLNGNASAFVAGSREISTLGTALDAKLDAYGLSSCGSNFGLG